jgi:hypothetical protein
MPCKLVHPRDWGRGLGIADWSGQGQPDEVVVSIGTRGKKLLRSCSRP